MPKTILLDGNNFAIRILTSIPRYNAQFKSNHQINLFIHSFFNTFLLTCNKIKQKYHAVDNIAIVWDSKINNRKLIYSEYKSNRHPKTLEEERDKLNFYSLLNELRDQLKLLGNWAHIEIEGYEADDIIAYFVKNSTIDNNFIIISSDNDLYQLLGMRCIMYLQNKKEFYTHLDFQREFGIIPDKYPQVKALAGDNSDNIKGIYGIGIKKGIKLINEGKCWQYWIDKYKDIDLETNLELVKLPFEEHKIPFIELTQSYFDKPQWVGLFQKYNLHKLNLSDFKQLLDNENKKLI